MSLLKQRWVGVTLSVGVALIFGSKALALACDTTELQCYAGGGTTTDWSSAWQSFTTGGVSGKALDAVVLRLRAGSTNTAEGLTVAVYGESDGTGDACSPVISSLLATSNAVTVANDATYYDVTFSFADEVPLDPAETYYLKLQDPDYNSGDQVIVKDSVSPIPGGAGGNCGTLHHRILGRDLVGTVPGAPTIGAATGGNAQATVTWTAPADNGGYAISSYTATAVEDNTKSCTTTDGSTLTCTVTGLTNGTAYAFTVTATNVVGTGAASSASNAVTPATVPGAPTIGAATAGNAQATVTWTAPADNGGAAISSYTATAVEDNTKSCTTADGSTLTCTVTGLTNGTAYTFTVTATNAEGPGAASSASIPVTPGTIPGAPTIGAATAGNTQATVTWAAPADDGGSTISSYTATAVEDNTKSCTIITATRAVLADSTAEAAALTCTVTGLTNGTAYTFTVTATNFFGTGAASSASNSVTPATVPDAPTDVTAVAGDGEATVSWTAPASDGGAEITYYTATTNPSCTTSGTSCTVTGLTNGTAYTFTVTATNSAGTSAPSAPSNSVTPEDAPIAVGNAAPVPAVPGILLAMLTILLAMLGWRRMA